MISFLNRSIEGIRGSENSRYVQAGKALVPHSLHSLAATFRLWLAMQLVTLSRWTEDFRDWRRNLPDRAAVITDRNGFRLEYKITDTVIVLLGLSAILIVGFALGRQSDTASLHPVWQVIMGLAGFCMIGLSMRLHRLIRERNTSRV